MKILKFVPVLIFAFLTINQVALAEQKPSSSLVQGEKLVHKFWADIKTGDIAAIEKYMAKGFQSVHQDGTRTREQEIELIKGLYLGEYTLSNFKVTQNGPVILATYLVSVKETINGKRLSSEPAPRLSIFLKKDDGWKWIAHANLKSLWALATPNYY